MELAIVFLLGFFLGGIVVYWLIMRAIRRHTRPHLMDEQYSAARRAIARHFKQHDTINQAALARLMDISGVTALRYLEQLERDRCVKMQGHRGMGAFYTRP